MLAMPQSEIGSGHSPTLPSKWPNDVLCQVNWPTCPQQHLSQLIVQSCTSSTFYSILVTNNIMHSSYRHVWHNQWLSGHTQPCFIWKTNLSFCCVSCDDNANKRNMDSSSKELSHRTIKSAVTQITRHAMQDASLQNRHLSKQMPRQYSMPKSSRTNLVCTMSIKSS